MVFGYFLLLTPVVGEECVDKGESVNRFVGIPLSSMLERPSAANLSPSMRSLLEKQSIIDLENSVLVPLLEVDNVEFVVDKKSGNVVPIHTGSVMFRSSTAVLFDAQSTVLLKYQSDCLHMGQVHPLIREYWLMDRLANTGISVPVFYLSPPAVFDGRSESAKSSFDMSKEDRESCTNKGSVRVLAMEKAGMDIETIIKTVSPQGLGLSKSIRLMIDLIEKIERMHSLGVIHGDIHPGNIVTGLGYNLGDIRLVDFGNGLYEDQLGYEPELQREPLSATLRYSSPWNLAGIVPSFRDDVYRALLVGAMAMNGKAYLTFCEMLEWYPPVMFRFKHHYLIFQLPGGQDFLHGIADEVREEIKETLGKALNISRSVDNLFEKPDYHSIIYELRIVYELVNKTLLING